MFIFALIIAVILGYLLKGSLKNIDAAKVKGLYFVSSAIILEFIIIKLLKNSYLTIGALTYVLDLIMYILLLTFVYLNRSNKWIMIVGIGIILNAVVIFSNGGAMPVDVQAVKALGFTGEISSQGLYVEMQEATRFAFLGDILPMKYPKPGVASIGDFVEVIGLALYIITEMKNKKSKINIIKIEQ
jgi:hypothetical protein